MKIAIVSDVIFPFVKGGVESRYHKIAKHLVNGGHEVHMFGSKWWEGNNTITRDGMTLHGVCKAADLYVKHRRSMWQAMHFSLNLFPYLLRNKFEVIESSLFPFLHCYPTKLVSLIQGTGLVISWWECWGDYWYEYLGKLGFLGKGIERLTKYLPHRIITETECNKNTLTSWGVDASKIAVIPSGTNFYEIQKLAAAKENLDIVYLGRLVRDKGIYTLIDVVSRLVGNFKDIKAGIIGDGPERDNLRIVVKKLGIEGNIKLFGALDKDDEVFSIMKSAKVFIYPTVPAGGWSIVSVEANACGLPVVTVRCGALGNTESTIDGYNGFLVDEQSPQQIAGKIDLLLTDERLKERMSRNALDFARRHDWKKLTQDVVDVYQSVVKKS